MKKELKLNNNGSFLYNGIGLNPNENMFVSWTCTQKTKMRTELALENIRQFELDSSVTLMSI